jgi:thymidylate synthase (FAD)
MNVELVSVTQSVLAGKFLTAEELIVYIARVSNPANQMNTETSDKLIAYLIKNHHWSPFEMVDMCVEIKTSRAIAAQILRHRSFSFQEFSQRYAEVTDMEPVQLRKQAEKNRQSSEESFDPILDGGTGGHTLPTEASSVIALHLEQTESLYKELLSKGVAKECARMVLPLTTQTTIYMKGSVRSWIHYLSIRTDQHTQLEHREVAEMISNVFENNFPNITKALHG